MAISSTRARENTHCNFKCLCALIAHVTIIRRKFSKLFLGLGTLLAMNACALFEPSFEPFTSPAIVDTGHAEPDHPTTDVQVQPVMPKESGDDSIVIKWLVPEEELDGYVIRYGFSATSLEYEERLEWSRIGTITDASRGKIFVHNLKGLPTDKTIFVSLAGIKDDKLSKPTAIFSVSPTKPAE